MVSGINSIGQSAFQPRISQDQTYNRTDYIESSNSFDIEDEAIISSEAKLLNELDRFNSGEGNLVDLAVASVMSKATVSAVGRVIQTKKEMYDYILDIAK